MAKMTISKLKDKKIKKEKITMVTAYDYPSAKIVDDAEIDMILVGDSLGMVMLGYETTIPVTMDDMIHHTKAVNQGAKNTFVVADMPFLSYNLSINEAVANAGRFLQEAGIEAVKLEGGQERVEVIKAIVDAGIPVLGHIGLTPQSVHQLGGYKVQGKSKEQAQKLIEDAKALEEAGVFGVVLECVPTPIAEIVTNEISIPTIGIGAGSVTDGQVLVWHDLLGFSDGPYPRFVKKYKNLYAEIIDALTEYKKEVETGQFPQKEHTFDMDTDNIPKVY